MARDMLIEIISSEYMRLALIIRSNTKYWIMSSSYHQNFRVLISSTNYIRFCSQVLLC